MSVTFDLTGSNSGSSSIFLSEGGLDLTVTSGLFNGGGGDYLVYENTPVLNQTADGLGMTNPYGDASAAVDGDGKKEIAILSFSQVVKITSVTLIPVALSRTNEFAEGVKFRLFGEGLVVTPKNVLIEPDHSNDVALYGALLGIGADGSVDGFRIAAITVEFPALATLQDDLVMTRGVNGITFDALANDTDARTILSVDTTGLVGSVTIGADGRSLTYQSGGAFSGLIAGQTSVETFTYDVLGWDGTTQTETVSVTIRGAGGENFVTGTNGKNTLNGGMLGDTISGLAGNDSLFGHEGDDLLLGGSGKDVLDGQMGADEMQGGADNDTYYVDDLFDRVIENAAEGSDTVISSVDFTLGDNLEKLTLAGTADLSGTGNSLANTILGNSGSNSLTGGGGKDTLNGGAGADLMAGGADSDSYVVDHAADQVIELNDDGTDKVTASLDWTLGDNIETLVLAEGGHYAGTGNFLANTLTGNSWNNALSGLSGADSLSGGQGQDSLAGGRGKDTLTGGADADTFVFAESGNANFDKITDFTVGTDMIGLDGAAFGLAPGVLDPSVFTLGTAAGSSAHRIIYDSFNGDIWFDADGDGAGAKALIASVTDGLVLNWDDFLVL